MKAKKGLIPQKIKNWGKHLPEAILANLFFLFPSRRIKLIGVTGTDGKTTVSFLIYHLLSAAGKKAGLVSTVMAKIGGEEIATGLHVTSPHPWKLQQFLKRMVKEKIEYGVLETTSHGLDQYRFWGCHFLVGVLTNITHEHYDYHGNYRGYLLAKAKLIKKAKIAVLNKDDSSFSFLSQIRRGRPIVSYGIEKRAFFGAEEIRLGRRWTRFKIREKGEIKGEVVSPLLGEFNVANILAAVAAVRSLGVEYQVILPALKNFPGVPGRMEFIPNKQEITVVIDFAHTPNALEKVLRFLRSRLPREGRLIVVFGAAGERDASKRKPMGMIAAREADLIVLTSEDPRGEKPEEIVRQIAAGCRQLGVKRLGLRRASEVKAKKLNRGYFVVINRQEAINFAIRRLAQKKDVVVICGKGHERSMCFGTTEYPWSEHEAVRIALREKRR